MGKLHDAIDAPVAEFIARQHMFFVATAPLAGDGHVNLSPKGLDAFAVPRPIVRVALTRIADSCGYGVPLYRHEGDRPQLAEWARRKGAEGAAEYRRANNRESIDGLPGLRGDR